MTPGQARPKKAQGVMAQGAVNALSPKWQAVACARHTVVDGVRSPRGVDGTPVKIARTQMRTAALVL